MSFNNGQLCGVSSANVLPFRTRSQQKAGMAIVDTIIDLTPPKETWVKRESTAEGYWVEQVNPRLSSFGECKWVATTISI